MSSARFAFSLASFIAAAPCALVAQAPADSRPTVAVVGFTGGSLAKPGDYAALGRGIAELLSTDLAARGDIRLAERERLAEVLSEHKLVETSQIDPTTAVALGKVLGVRHFVTGGFIIDAKNRMRLDVRAINVETSEIEYRETVEGKVDDVFDLVDRIEKKLSTAIGTTIAVQQAGIARPSGKGDASQATLHIGRATRALQQRDTTAAVSAVKDALTAFPNFPRAKALLDSLTAKKP
jgi:TolB-like protein